jgi:hypothetical protein
MALNADVPVMSQAVGPQTYTPPFLWTLNPTATWCLHLDVKFTPHIYLDKNKLLFPQTYSPTGLVHCNK